MNYKQISIALIITAIGSFLCGRYLADKPTVTQVVDTKKDKEVVKNEKKVITRVKDKDGKVTTVTTVDTTTDSKSTQLTHSDTKTESTGNKFRAGVLLGIDKDENHTKGLMVEANMFGPLNMGAFYLDNKTYGFTLTVGF